MYQPGWRDLFPTGPSRYQLQFTELGLDPEEYPALRAAGRPKTRPRTVQVGRRKTIARCPGTRLYVPGFHSDLVQAQIDRKGMGEVDIVGGEFSPADIAADMQQDQFAGLGVGPFAVYGAARAAGVHITLRGKREAWDNALANAMRGSPYDIAVILVLGGPQSQDPGYPHWADARAKLLTAHPEYSTIDVPAAPSHGADPQVAYVQRQVVAVQRGVSIMPTPTPGPAQPALPPPAALPVTVKTPIGVMTPEQVQALAAQLQAQNQQPPSWLSDVLKAIAAMQVQAPPPAAPPSPTEPPSTREAGLIPSGPGPSIPTPVLLLGGGLLLLAAMKK